MIQFDQVHRRRSWGLSMDLPARIQIPELLLWYRQGVLKLRELITRTYRLDEINRGYADLDAGRNLRGVVVFDH